MSAATFANDLPVILSENLTAAATTPNQSLNCLSFRKMSKSD
jgi:hypothetical protein